MDRRSFLRRVGLAGGAALVAPRVLPDLLASPETVAEASAVAKASYVPDVALVASGGLCAPITPYYSLPVISSRVRPLRDARIIVE